MESSEAVQRARRLFLDERHEFGCAETALLVLQEAFGLPDAGDASAAMALNGGIAYSGGMCGAITGAALAVGRLAGERVDDPGHSRHAAAKKAAREEVAELIDAFAERFGATDCRALLGRSIRTSEEHAAFIQSGVWRGRCMAQIEFAVARLASLPMALDGNGTTPDGARR